MFFNKIVFFLIFILKGHVGTLLHQRHSEAAICRCFTKQIFLKILLGSVFVSGLKRLRHECFPVNFRKNIKNAFFTEHLEQLLLGVSRRITFVIDPEV